MRPNILITGATGHLGNTLVRMLLEKGHSIRALIYEGEDTISLNNLPVERVEGDILSPGSVRDALEGIEYVYHLAGVISIGGISDDVVHRVNVQGTRNVAIAARESGVKRMVYVSSIHALVRPEKGVRIDESLPFYPENPAGEYDRSKAIASLEVLELTKTGLDAVVICPTGIIGPNDFRGSEIGRMISRWMESKLHFMTQGYFDFVDVRDVANGLILACERGTKGETYILSGTRIRIGEIRSIVQRAVGIESPQIMIPPKLAMAGAAVFGPIMSRLSGGSGFTKYSIETVQSNSEVSSDKAKRELGFFQRSIESTIRESVAWWRENWQLSQYPEWYGKVALITGASSGIGAATARKLAAMGMVVILAARRRDRLEALADEIRSDGGRAEVIHADLTDEGAAEAIMGRISSQYHGVDVLVNNAGLGWYGFFSDMGWETAQTMLAVNNNSLVQLSLLALPRMIKRRRGHIINIGSIAGDLESQGVALYSATKSFINAFTRAISRELKGSKIRISVVRPGMVRSGFFKAAEQLANGRAIPGAGAERGIQPVQVAERISRLLRRPRTAAYVPRGLWFLRPINTLIGWTLDILGPIHLRKHAALKS